MNEDLSATIRTGVTVVIVAALVSTILSLMVIAQTILSGGMVKLQSSVSAVNMQEFETYNGGSQSGTEVKSAIALFGGSDYAILIHSVANTNHDPTGVKYWWNYGALLEGSTEITYKVNGADNKTWTGDGADNFSTGIAQMKPGNSFFTGAFKTENGVIKYNGNKKGLSSKGCGEYILASAYYSSYLIKDSNGLIIGIAFVAK